MLVPLFNKDTTSYLLIELFHNSHYFDFANYNERIFQISSILSIVIERILLFKHHLFRSFRKLGLTQLPILRIYRYLMLFRQRIEYLHYIFILMCLIYYTICYHSLVNYYNSWSIENYCTKYTNEYE